MVEGEEVAEDMNEEIKDPPWLLRGMNYEYGKASRGTCEMCIFSYIPTIHVKNPRCLLPGIILGEMTVGEIDHDMSVNVNGRGVCDGYLGRDSIQSMSVNELKILALNRATVMIVPIGGGRI